MVYLVFMEGLFKDRLKCLFLVFKWCCFTVMVVVWLRSGRMEWLFDRLLIRSGSIMEACGSMLYFSFAFLLGIKKRPNRCVVGVLLCFLLFCFLYYLICGGYEKTHRSVR